MDMIDNNQGKFGQWQNTIAMEGGEELVAVATYETSLGEAFFFDDPNYLIMLSWIHAYTMSLI